MPIPVKRSAKELKKTSAWITALSDQEDFTFNPSYQPACSETHAYDSMRRRPYPNHANEIRFFPPPERTNGGFDLFRHPSVVRRKGCTRWHARLFGEFAKLLPPSFWGKLTATPDERVGAPSKRGEHVPINRPHLSSTRWLSDIHNPPLDCFDSFAE